MIKRVVFGAVGNPHVAECRTSTAANSWCSACSRSAFWLMGLYPFPFTEVMHASVDNLLKHVAVSKL
jgi:NADH-quinone oxidoreductase subunit M